MKFLERNQEVVAGAMKFRQPLKTGSLRKADLSFDADINVHRTENEQAREEQPRQLFLMNLHGIVGHQDECSGKKAASQNMKRNQDHLLKATDARGFEFDDAEQSHDEENSGKNVQRVSDHQRLHFFSLSGARE